VAVGRKAWVIVIGVALCVFLVAALVVVRALTDGAIPDGQLGAIEPAALPGAPVGVAGVIKGSEGNGPPEWYQVLEIQTPGGKVEHVVINSHSQVSTASLPPVPDSLARELGMPHFPLGYRLDCKAKSFGYGLLGLRRILIVEAGAVRHP